ALPDTTNLAPMQGSPNFKDGSITLSGLVNSTVSNSSLPDAMNVYTGIAWWQDRRNSMVGYDQPLGSYGCTNSTFCNGDDGSVVFCSLAGECADGGDTASLSAMLSANNVLNPTSPVVELDPGNV